MKSQLHSPSPVALLKRKIKELRDAEHLRREGSNKYGQWIGSDEV
ncbi:hypothetical protein AB0Y02_07215 [Phocaeicola dorei]